MCQEKDNDVHLSYGFDNFPQANSIFNFSWRMYEIQAYHGPIIHVNIIKTLRFFSCPISDVLPGDRYLCISLMLCKAN